MPGQPDLGPWTHTLLMPELPPFLGLESLSSQLRSNSPEADGILCLVSVVNHLSRAPNHP